MRKRVSKGGLTVHAIAGSYVVVLGLDVSPAKRKGLRGFAIKRTDHVEGESYWMSGTKVFESVVPHPEPGGQYSSLRHPFQSFQWSDYSAKPGYRYTYQVVAMYGPVAALEQRAKVLVNVTTEAEEGAEHTIRFNRGSVATQEYARRFQNLPPTPLKKGGPSAGPAAFDWLSRGLVEGIVAFIRRAKGSGWGLRGCFYEFQWAPVLDELQAAKARGADVRIVYDDIAGSGPHALNEKAIEAAKIESICKPRRRGTLMHNKFLVLTRNAKPVAVLFGSTNLTLNGLFGHANCTHVVENAAVAAKYLAFHERLHVDPETTSGSPYKQWTIDETPAPPTELIEKTMAPVFSPRANRDALDWYGELAGSAKDGLFMTFAFGMNETFRQVYGRNDAVLRVGLMEKEWTGAHKEAQIEAVRKLQALPNVVIAIGNRVPINGFDQWLGEIDKIDPKAQVLWVHLKFMLVDPLSKHPIVVTGSANFSEASTTTNDENMLVIEGDTRVADVYLGEYMRIYSHYAFREALAIFLAKNPGAKPQDMKQGFLVEQGDWTRDYFDPHDTKARRARRIYFAG